MHNPRGVALAQDILSKGCDLSSEVLIVGLVPQTRELGTTLLPFELLRTAEAPREPAQSAASRARAR